MNFKQCAAIDAYTNQYSCQGYNLIYSFEKECRTTFHFSNFFSQNCTFLLCLNWPFEKVESLAGYDRYSFGIGIG